MEKKRKWILFLLGIVIAAVLVVAIIPTPMFIGFTTVSACKSSLKALTDDWGPDYNNCAGDWKLEGIKYSSTNILLTFNDGTNFGYCRYSKIESSWDITFGPMVTLLGCLQDY